MEFRDSNVLREADRFGFVADQMPLGIIVRMTNMTKEATEALQNLPKERQETAGARHPGIRIL